MYSPINIHIAIYLYLNIYSVFKFKNSRKHGDGYA